MALPDPARWRRSFTAAGLARESQSCAHSDSVGHAHGCRIDLPERIYIVVRRVAAEPISLGRGRVAEQHSIADPVFLNEGTRVGERTVWAQDRKQFFVAPEPVVEGVEGAELGSTHATPGRPKMQQDALAAKVRELDLLAVDAGKAKIRSRLP